MDAGITALAAAAVGVVGTLLSPVLAQRATARSNRPAGERERAMRADERVAAEHRTIFEERRAAYTSLNALARAARNTMKSSARHHAATGALGPDDLAAAREAWTAHQDRYDEL